MSAEKTRQCNRCGGEVEMEFRKGPFEINIFGRSRTLTGNFYHCRNCGNDVPDEALEMSVMDAEDW